MKMNINALNAVIKMYRMEFDGTDAIVHEPAYIRIRNYEVEEDPSCFEFKNKKVIVNLWKDVRVMHVTVL